MDVTISFAQEFNGILGRDAVELQNTHYNKVNYRATQIAKTLVLTSIRYRYDAKMSD